MNPRPPSPGSTSSKSLSSPYFSSSTAKNEDAVQITHTRYSAPVPLKACSACTRTRLPGPSKGRSGIQHTSVESPVCLAFCCCSLRISLVCWLWRHRYYQEFLYLFDDRPSCLDVSEVEMFAFLASAAFLLGNCYFAGCGDESLLPPVLRQFWWWTFSPMWGDRSRDVCVFGCDIANGTYGSRQTGGLLDESGTTSHSILWTNDGMC